MPNLGENVTILMPKKKVGSQAPSEEKKKLRVAAYARVSTDNEEQEGTGVFQGLLNHFLDKADEILRHFGIICPIEEFLFGRFFGGKCLIKSDTSEASARFGNGADAVRVGNTFCIEFVVRKQRQNFTLLKRPAVIIPKERSTVDFLNDSSQYKSSK